VECTCDRECVPVALIRRIKLYCRTPASQPERLTQPGSRRNSYCQLHSSYLLIGTRRFPHIGLVTLSVSVFWSITGATHRAVQLLPRGACDSTRSLERRPSHGLWQSEGSVESHLPSPEASVAGRLWRITTTTITTAIAMTRIT